jgi:hypothetical protein
LHAAEGRLAGKLPPELMPPEEDGPDRFAAGVDVALRYGAPLVEVI